MSCNQSTKSCAACPFSRTSIPGSLGGSPITTYLGQAQGPFFLPCHMPWDYKGNDAELDGETMHCAGAAIFRANVGVAEKLPWKLLKLPAKSDDNVFRSYLEFVMHHEPKLSKKGAEALVRPQMMALYLKNEFIIAKALPRNRRSRDGYDFVEPDDTLSNDTRPS